MEGFLECLASGARSGYIRQCKPAVVGYPDANSWVEQRAVQIGISITLGLVFVKDRN